ncbi:helix-turn-helix domain-containing protein [Thalassobaculum sp. OXR-137]|uniref:helix-turn-helix domain-containing protein n=1 Tax=Thalassobaculum sp. OXR-137 TaxID=3100173 RepID=UPI002AC95837|nr:helix-turn-helix domain-containing protein [Thalassobaculum sp. OXR-137]WPZ33987.1 helix-turn-helix domain-containing protein [Thalassobaculum sp. OXR-137]
MSQHAALPSLSLRPGTAPNEELFWHWRTGISHYFRSVPLVDPRRPTRAPEVHFFNAGSFHFYHTDLSEQQYVRDAAWLRRNDDSDPVALQLFLRGTNQVENAGHSFVMDRGAVTAVNLGYEVHSSCTEAEALTLALPRAMVAEHLPTLHETIGTLFPLDTTPGRLLADFMMSLRETLPKASAADAPLLSKALFGLLQVLVADGEPHAIDARDGALTAVQRYIEMNLGNPDLGVASICAKYRMSRATLYRLFQDKGGVQGYIRRRRLMACFQALSSESQMKRGIFDIGLEYGFTSPSHFTTRFRDEFGMTPSEVRESAQAHHARGVAAILTPASSDLPDVELMRRWSLELGDHDRHKPANDRF